jgi:uncharacterized protein YecE (DUF72 family)
MLEPEDAVIWIGTSGWQYRDWRGPVYPTGLATSGWLAAYAARFPTVELNNSFYRLPEAEAFRRWREQTPDGFVIAVKASRYLTHVTRLRDPEEPMARLWSRARELGPRLGPFLFQLPPRFPAAPERLRALLAAVPEGVRAAVEFRDPSWFSPAVFAALERVNAALVVADPPRTERETPRTSDWSYLRFHGATGHDAEYGQEALRPWAARVASLAGDVWIYFNDDVGGAAVRDAERLRRLLRDLVPDRVAEPSRPA